MISKPQYSCASDPFFCDFSEQEIRAFDCFIAHLLKWNVKIGFSKYSNPDDITQRLIIPSLYLSTLIPDGANIIDLGTGPGIPGLPIAMHRTDLSVTLLDSREACIEFLSTFLPHIPVENVVLMLDRAEKVAHDEKCRESYDLILSRSFAVLPVSLEIGAAYVKPGGDLIYTVPSAVDSISVPSEVMRLLGIEFQEVIHDSWELGVSFGKWRKVASIDPRFPRNWKTMKTSPMF